MKNIDQIKSLIIRCCQKDIEEISITVYNEGGHRVLWSRIDIEDDSTIILNAVYIYSNYHIAFNLSSTDTSITVYDADSINKKIQTSFKNDSSTLSVI